MFERFTNHARMIMGLANQTAQHHNQYVIETEHILLGLIKVSDCNGTTVLTKIGVDLQELQQDIHGRIKNEAPTSTTPRSRSTRAKFVVERAIEEAVHNLGSPYVGSEHLLLGLLHEKDTIAGQSLSHSGVTLEAAYREIEKLPPEQDSTG